MRAVILWINGAFGAGKTSTAQAICKRLPDAHLFDPEQVGYFLWDNFPESLRQKGDFQDLPLWREMTFRILQHLHHHDSGTLVVPMTIYRKQYYDEILGRLMAEGICVWHYILTARRETVLQRLLQRGETADGFGARHLAICEQAFLAEIPGEKIRTDGRSIDETAARILSLAGI